MQCKENNLPELWSIGETDSEVLTTLSSLSDLSDWDGISDAASEISCDMR